MTEILLIIFAAGLIYYVAVKLTPKGFLFRMKKEEDSPKKETEKNIAKNPPVEKRGLIEDGQKYLNIGNLTKAEKLFIEAIKENPKEAKAYHFLGMIYLRQNQFDVAAESLELATKLDQLNDTAYNNLGLAYYNIGKNTEAIEVFKKSIQLNDKIGHRYVNLGLAYQAVGDHQKAIVSFENSVRIHPNSESLSLLAKCYIKVKDKKSARNALERLLSFEPNNSWAKRILASYGD